MDTASDSSIQRRVQVLCLQVAVVCFCSQAVTPCLAQSQTNAAGSTASQSPHLRLAISEGTVDAAELWNSVAGEVHPVAGSVAGFAKALAGPVPTTVRMSVEQLEELMAKHPGALSFEVDENGTRTFALIDIEQFSAMMADRKSKLRAYLSEVTGRPLASFFRVDQTWSENEVSPPRVIVVLSGLNGVDSTSVDVATGLYQRVGQPACVFDYPNDGPIADSARMLVEYLQDFHRQYPATRVTLVTHSMGGLVARAALEMSSLLDTPAARSESVTRRTGVDQLIQVCPPNHGSALAEYGPLLEGAEQVYRLIHRRSSQRDRALFRAIVDGFNEASADLSPDSKFLQELNAQARNTEVRYSVLCGDDAPLRGTMTNLLSNVWSRIAVSIDEPQEITDRIELILNCEELQKGKGDGVVSLASTRLVGVKDIEVLPMHHLVWNQLDTPAGRQMLDAVASRLGISL